MDVAGAIVNSFVMVQSSQSSILVFRTDAEKYPDIERCCFTDRVSSNRKTTTAIKSVIGWETERSRSKLSMFPSGGSASKNHLIFRELSTSPRRSALAHSSAPRPGKLLATNGTGAFLCQPLVLALLKIVAIMVKLIMLLSVEIAERCVGEPCPAPGQPG